MLDKKINSNKCISILECDILRIRMPFEFQSHSKFKAKLSGTFWTCKQYFPLFIVSLKFLFQSAGLIQNIIHFENPLIWRLLLI